MSIGYRAWVISTRIITVVAIVIILFAIITPSYSPSTKRSIVARVKGDERTISLSLETYYIDHNNYPAWSLRNDENAFGGIPDKKGKLARIPTFLSPHHAKPITLTTPIAYLSIYYADPFAPIKGATFAYWTPEKDHGIGYILWSPGPDETYGLTIENVAGAYDASTSATIPSEMLIGLTYDPSNGTVSGGDVWRVKE